MTPENPPTPEITPKTCIETTKAGKPCSNRVVSGSSVCFSHSSAGAEQRERATQASAKARSDRVEARKEASEEAKLTITERLQRKVAERATQLVDSLVAAAEADGSSRAMDTVWNRIEGKVSDQLSVSRHDPSLMNEAELYAWLGASTESPTVDEPSVSTDERPDGHTERPNSSSKDPV